MKKKRIAKTIKIPEKLHTIIRLEGARLGFNIPQTISAAMVVLRKKEKKKKKWKKHNYRHIP